MASIDLTQLVDFSQPSFWYAVAIIVLAPTIWNTLARLEFYTHILTKIAGSPYRGCYALAIWIFSFSLYRDKVFNDALLHQPKWDLLESLPFQAVAVLFVAAGLTFVLSSMWALGVTGTYLGDYFGILMDAMVTGFPFNVLDNPMYVGSTLSFIGISLWNASPAGLVLSALIFIVYQIALLFEGPFTTYIYAQRAKKNAASNNKNKKNNKNNKKGRKAN